MKITIESTDQIIEVSSEDGRTAVPARVWEGKTERGVQIFCLVTRIAVHKDGDTSQFEAELMETAAPRVPTDQPWPLRLVL